MLAFLSLYGRVVARLAPERGLALILALANLGLAGSQFAEPLLFGAIVDRLAESQAAGEAPRFVKLAPLLAAWVGFGLFSIVAGVLVSLNADRLAHRRRVAAMAEFFERALTLPMRFHETAHSGRLLKIMIDGAGGMFSVWLAFFREHLASLVAIFVLLPTTLVLNWRLASVLIALFFISGALMSLVIRRSIAMQGVANEAQNSLAERVSDTLGNLPAIQSFARLNEEAAALKGLIGRVIDAQLPVLAWWAFASMATRASATIALLTIFLVGIWLDARGETSLGQIVAFVGLATALIGRLEQLIGFASFLFDRVPQIAQFFAVLDAEPTVADREDAKPAPRFLGHVRFEDVSFRYGPERASVSGLSFDAPAGAKIALVGQTGSGKSTTLALLHRVYDPDSGRITIDGRDIREFTLASLRMNIGVVFQEPFLLARSIEDNLRLGKPDASLDEMRRALAAAEAEDFVAQQPDALLTPIGERGRTLSGGERQRLAIARALLKDPPILILDEATSALDAATEARVQKALSAAMRGRTTFVIAHRLSTIREADEILVFDRGRIAERGDFAALKAKGGLFSELVKAQRFERLEDLTVTSGR